MLGANLSQNLSPRAHLLTTSIKGLLACSAWAAAGGLMMKDHSQLIKLKPTIASSASDASEALMTVDNGQTAGQS